MKQLVLLIPFFLGGCVPTFGSYFTGEHELINEEFPDIRTVPGRAEASQQRYHAPQQEKIEQTQEKKQLDQEKKKAQDLNRSLRTAPKPIID